MKQEPRFFSAKQFNRIAFDAAHAIAKYSKFMRLVDKTFQKQIMLAVSGVNKCSICSYVHTKSLLKSGASNEELKMLYEGKFENLDENITFALVFSEHYADQGGNYDQEAFEKVIEYYGKNKAYGIMATIKMIMFGNTNGIALGNLGARFKFKKNKNSKFFTDLYNGPFAYILLPLFLLINLFTKKRIY